MARIFVILSGLLGFSAVALGAFGAHGLRSRLGPLPDGVKRLEWWNTAAHYHLTHALALALAAWLVHRGAGSSATVAGWSFVAGVGLFSGSLYTMTITRTDEARSSHAVRRSAPPDRLGGSHGRGLASRQRQLALLLLLRTNLLPQSLHDFRWKLGLLLAPGHWAAWHRGGWRRGFAGRLKRSGVGLQPIGEVL